MREIRNETGFVLCLLPYVRCLCALALLLRRGVCLFAYLVSFCLANQSSCMFTRMFHLFSFPLLILFLTVIFCYWNDSFFFFLRKQIYSRHKIAQFYCSLLTFLKMIMLMLDMSALVSLMQIFCHNIFPVVLRIATYRENCVALKMPTGD